MPSRLSARASITTSAMPLDATRVERDTLLGEAGAPVPDETEIDRLESHSKVLRRAQVIVYVRAPIFSEVSITRVQIL